MLKYNFIFLILLLTSCNSSRVAVQKSLIGTAEKESLDLIKNSSPEFRKGWLDGCEAAIGMMGNRFYKSFYKTNKIDGYKFATSSDYSTGWGTAMTYCARLTAIKHKATLWKTIFSGYM